MAKRMSKEEHALWRKNRSEELIQRARDLRPEFVYFRSLTIHHKFPYQRIITAFEGVMDLLEDNRSLNERFEQARQCHNEPTANENAADDLLVEMVFMALQWLSALCKRAENHIEELLDKFHVRAPPRHMHKLVMKCICRQDFEASWERAWRVWDYVRCKQEAQELGQLGRGVKRACRQD